MKFELYMLPIGMMVLAALCFIVAAYYASQIDVAFYDPCPKEEKGALGLLLLAAIIGQHH